MAEIGKVVQMKPIWSEAVGTRKGLGKIEFIPNPEFVGDVAEMEYDAASALLRGETEREKGGLPPMFREAVLKKGTTVPEPEPEQIKKPGRPFKKVNIK